MKTPPWDDGYTLPVLIEEYNRLDRDGRNYVDVLATHGRLAARAYLAGRVQMRENLAGARDSARKAVRAGIDAGERREREGGGA